MLLGIKGMGDDHKIKGQLANKLSQKDVLEEDWDNICEKGSQIKSKENLSVSVRCTQLSTVAKSHFMLQQTGDLKLQNQTDSRKITNKLFEWIFTIKSNQEIEVLSGKIDYISVVNLSSALDYLTKYFFVVGVDNTDLKEKLQTFLDLTLTLKEKSFSIVDFFNEFSTLHLSPSDLPLLEKFTSVICCWKDHSGVIEIFKLYLEELKEIINYKFDISEKTNTSFVNTFHKFIELTKFTREFTPFIHHVIKSLETTNNPDLIIDLQSDLEKQFENKLTKDELLLDQYPLDIKLNKNQIEFTTLEDTEKSIEQELEKLKLRIKILEEKESFIDKKTENHEIAQKMKDTFQKLSNAFKQELPKWKEQLEIFKKQDTQMMLKNCFENLVKNIEVIVQSDVESLRNQMVNYIGKTKADLKRYFFPLFKTEEKQFTEKLEKLVGLCISYRENEKEKPSTPVPEMPVNFKDFQRLGNKIMQGLLKNVQDTVQQVPVTPRTQVSLSQLNQCNNISQGDIVESYICKWDVMVNENEKKHSAIEAKSGDVFNVFYKEQSWYYGINTSSQETGWIHSSNLVED